MWRPRFLSATRSAVMRRRPSQTLFFWLLGAFILTLVPHLGQLPVWVTGCIAVALTIRIVLEVSHLRLPSTTFTGILAVCLIFAIWIQFRTITGREAGTAFLTALVTIKFYEIRGPRDISLIIFSSFFVVMSALLYSQAFELFIYCLIMMWVLTALLLRTQLGDLPQDRLLRMLGRSGLIYLQVLPLAVVLFFFFPRYTGKFPFASDEASLGLTDIVAPGSISRLIDNDSEAMRVKFTKGNVPSIDTMYWRAIVLWTYREGAWVPGKIASVPLRPDSWPQAEPDSDVIDQEITIDANFHPWLVALDTPTSIAANSAEPITWSAFMRGNILQVAGRETVDHRERYNVTSSLQLASRPLPPTEQTDALELPTASADGRELPIDPRVKELADRLQKANPGTQPYILAVLRYFRQEGFTYTTSPGIEGKNALGDFLFRTKSGYCEHYASAFAVLMRLENHPARVIAGYHGGEYNPYGNFYIVRQSNAHAWDEVWDEGQSRWMRVDPSSVLATGNGGLAASGGNDPGNFAGAGALRSHFPGSGYLPSWAQRGLIEVQLRRQQVEADWDDWVFSYDPEAQIHLAQALGFGGRGLLIFAGICLLAFIGCAFFFYQLMRQRKRISPIESTYHRFCRVMAQRGVPRSPWEGPFAYTERVAEVFPEKSAAIHDLGSLVAHSRYAPAPPDPDVAGRIRSLLLSISANSPSP